VNVRFRGAEPFKLIAGTASAVGLLIGGTYVLTNFSEVKEKTLSSLFGAIKAVPLVSGKLEEEKAKLQTLFRKDLHQAPETDEEFRAIPSKGLPHEEILSRMKQWQQFDAEKGNWKDGYFSGVVYGNSLEHFDLQSKVYQLFSITNPLHPECFPSIRKFESEVVRMTASMLHGDASVCGFITSGGSESILMAVKAYRDYAKKSHPEIVIPVTAHAAFEKACHYFGIKCIKIGVDSGYRVDVKAMNNAINSNTILIVGSAPGYPHGVIDPIEEMASVALLHKVPLHVDACLGGFFLPFAQKISKDVPLFDFSVQGVTSISCDTHKYGYSVKGTSVLLFSNKSLRRATYFVSPDWPGGTYASPSVAGSRAGGLIACAWASLVAMGQDGFESRARGIYEAAQTIKNGIKKINGLRLMGDSYSSVIAFDSPTLNIFMISEQMKKRGWHLNNLQKPAGIHICLTALHIGKGDKFLQDLVEVTNSVKENPAKFNSDTVAMYGLASSIPDRTIITDMCSIYLDTILEVKGEASS